MRKYRIVKRVTAESPLCPEYLCQYRATPSLAWDTLSTHTVRQSADLAMMIHMRGLVWTEEVVWEGEEIVEKERGD